MAKYTGLVGKLENNIFNGSGKGIGGAAMYAGIGAAVGGIGGALTNSEDRTSGALRGAVLGAGLGAATNTIPKGISNTFKKSGFYMPDRKAISEVGDHFTTDYRPFYDVVNTPENKEYAKSYMPVVKQSLKEGGTDSDFFENFSVNMAKRAKEHGANGANLGPERVMELGDAAQSSFEAFEKHMSESGGRKEIDKAIHGNMKIWKASSAGMKVGIATSAVASAGFESMMHHIAAPTGQFFKNLKDGKAPGWRNSFATAASALGAYEGYNVLNNTSEGNYGSAAGGMLMLGLGKVAFSQGVNAFDIGAAMKKKGLTPQGLKAAMGVGFILNKLKNGAKNMEPEQKARIVQRLQDIG